MCECLNSPPPSHGTMGAAVGARRRYVGAEGVTPAGAIVISCNTFLGARLLPHLAGAGSWRYSCRMLAQCALVELVWIGHTGRASARSVNPLPICIRRGRLSLVKSFGCKPAAPTVAACLPADKVLTQCVLCHCVIPTISGRRQPCRETGIVVRRQGRPSCGCTQLVVNE